MSFIGTFPRIIPVQPFSMAMVSTLINPKVLKKKFCCVQWTWIQQVCEKKRQNLFTLSYLSFWRDFILLKLKIRIMISKIKSLKNSWTFVNSQATHFSFCEKIKTIRIIISNDKITKKSVKLCLHLSYKEFQNSDWPFYWLDFSLQGCIAVKSQAKLRYFKRPLARPFSQLSVSNFGLKGFLKGKEDKSWRENCFSSSLLLIPSKLELSLGGFAVRLFGKKKINW